MDIRWMVSVPASGLHAVGELLRGRSLVDTTLAEKLLEPVDLIQAASEIWGIDPIVLVDHLTAVCVEQSSVDQQARLAIRKAAGEAAIPHMAPTVTGWMQQVQSQFLRVHPDALNELELRAAPLREQWEARGPGLVARLRGFIGSEPLVDAAEVILVQPVMGGGGVAHIPYNRVSFEAVLANPVAELPEVVRLGWLLAQLQLDLPAIQGQLSRQRALQVGALANMAAILMAGHDVELNGPIETSLPRAMKAWQTPSADEDTLAAWWETYLADRPAWSSVLAALDQLLIVEQ